MVCTGAGVYDMVMEVFAGMTVNCWFLLAVMLVILLVFGMFKDDYAV